MSKTAAIACCSLCLLCACGGAASESPPPQTAAEPISTTTTAGEKDLRSSEVVSFVLGRAEAAYMDGRWGAVVVDAGRVLRGLASQDEFYAASRLLGLASCKRKDPRPIPTVWGRLGQADRSQLRAECARSGITLDEAGRPTGE